MEPTTDLQAQARRVLGSRLLLQLSLDSRQVLQLAALRLERALLLQRALGLAPPRLAVAVAPSLLALRLLWRCRGGRCRGGREGARASMCGAAAGVGTLQEAELQACQSPPPPLQPTAQGCSAGPAPAAAAPPPRPRPRPRPSRCRRRPRRRWRPARRPLSSAASPAHLSPLHSPPCAAAPLAPAPAAAAGQRWVRPDSTGQRVSERQHQARRPPAHLSVVSSHVFRHPPTHLVQDLARLRSHRQGHRLLVRLWVWVV